MENASTPTLERSLRHVKRGLEPTRLSNHARRDSLDSSIRARTRDQHRDIRKASRADVRQTIFDARAEAIFIHSCSVTFKAGKSKAARLMM